MIGGSHGRAHVPPLQKAARVAHEPQQQLATSVQTLLSQSMGCGPESPTCSTSRDQGRGRRLRGRPLVLVASVRGDRRGALEGLAIGVDAWWPLEDAMAARHPARGEPPIVRQGSPEAQDILVSIRPTRNDHPPGSVYAIMRTLGSCGDDDGCAMQVSPSGREVPGVLCPQGLPVAPSRDPNGIEKGAWERWEPPTTWQIRGGLLHQVACFCPKKSLCQTGWPRWSASLAARNNIQGIFAPKNARNMPPFSRQRFVANVCPTANLSGNVLLRRDATHKAKNSLNAFEFIPIYGPLCLRGKEAPSWLVNRALACSPARVPGEHRDAPVDT